MRNPEYFKYEIKRTYSEEPFGFTFGDMKIEDLPKLKHMDLEIVFYNDIDVRGLSLVKRFTGGDQLKDEYNMIYDLWFSAYEYFLKNEKETYTV